MHDGVTFYVVRHGETDWNAERRYLGQVDNPLNTKGRAQSKRNGAALRALLPQIANATFVASPLKRARETMEIVRAELGLPLENYRTDELLKELNYGHWEGKLQSDLPRLDADGVRERARDPYRWRPDGGESYADLMERTLKWLKSVEHDTVVVAHGGTMRTLSAHLLGLDVNRIPILDAPQDKVMVLSAGKLTWL